VARVGPVDPAFKNRRGTRRERHVWLLEEMGFRWLPATRVYVHADVPGAVVRENTYGATVSIGSFQRAVMKIMGRARGRNPRAY